MRKHPSIVVLTILAALMLVLAACQGTGASPSADLGLCRPVGDATAPETPAPETAEPGSSDLKIGLVTDVEPFFVELLHQLERQS